MPTDSGLAQSTSLTATPSSGASLSRYAAIAANPVILPAALRPKRVRDQGATSTCVSCSMAAALEGLRSTAPELSPLFHYYYTTKDSTGLNLSLDDALATMTGKGICSQARHDYPLEQGNTTKTPTADALKDAENYRIQRIQFQAGHEPPRRMTAMEIRDRLISRFAVLVGLRLPQGHPQDRAGDGTFLDIRGEWSDPAITLSGITHCVLAVGFSDGRLAFRVQDSYGSQKFDQGCWWLSYRVVDSPVVLQSLVVKR